MVVEVVEVVEVVAAVVMVIRAGEEDNSHLVLLASKIALA